MRNAIIAMVGCCCWLGCSASSAGAPGEDGGHAVVHPHADAGGDSSDAASDVEYIDSAAQCEAGAPIQGCEMIADPTHWCSDNGGGLAYLCADTTTYLQPYGCRDAGTGPGYWCCC